MNLPINTILQGDCLEVLKTLPDGIVDLLLQDTPFGCTQNEWDIKPNLPVMWEHWNRVTKDDGAMIFFATQPFASELILSNSKNFRYDLIWYKALGTGFLNANKMPMRNHEHILVFYRKLPTYNPQMGVGIRKKFNRKHERNGTNYGRFATEGTIQPYDDEGKRFPQSVLDFSNGDRKTENQHPTQKPLDIIRYLILTYSNAGELVFDGYMGSGTTAHAAIVTGRSFLGAENNAEYWKIASERIESVKRTPELFKAA